MKIHVSCKFLLPSLRSRKEIIFKLGIHPSKRMQKLLICKKVSSSFFLFWFNQKLILVYFFFLSKINRWFIKKIIWKERGNIPKSLGTGWETDVKAQNISVGLKMFYRKYLLREWRESRQTMYYYVHVWKLW